MKDLMEGKAVGTTNYAGKEKRMQCVLKNALHKIIVLNVAYYRHQDYRDIRKSCHSLIRMTVV